MKKNHLVALIAVAVALFAFIPQQSKDLGIPASFEAQRKEANTLRQLFAAGQYDSVINHCIAARAANTLGYTDQEQALATAWWYKGDKSRAYQYVLNNADYELALTGGAGNPFSMLYDLSFDTALATDRFLEQMITDRVTAYYSKSMHYYPECNTGLKLVILDYKLNLLRARYTYDLQHRGKKDREALDVNYRDACNLQTNKLLALLHDNGDKLYTNRDIGPAADKQTGMFHFFNREEDQAFAVTLLRKAFENKEITPDSYVDALLAAERLKNDNEQRLSKLQDSLCRIYKCRRMIMDSLHRFISYSGDSVRVIRHDSGIVRIIEALRGDGERMVVTTHIDTATGTAVSSIDSLWKQQGMLPLLGPGIKADSFFLQPELTK